MATPSYTDQAAALPPFCPVCGTGVVHPGDAKHGMVVQVPSDWHLRPPCAECQRRDEIKMRAAGERAAVERSKLILAAFLTPTSR